MGTTPPPGGAPQGVTTFWGQNNIKNEISTIKLLRVQIFSKIQQLLKITILGGIFLHFLGQKCPPGGELEFPRYINYDFLKEDHKNNFHTKYWEDSYRRLEVIGQKLSKMSILDKNGLKWTKFCHIRIFPAYRV